MEQQETNKAVAQALNELFVWFVGLQPNTRTKLPSVNIKQDEAIGVVKHINYIASLVGYKNRIQTNDDESVSVVLEEIKLPKTTDEALEEVANLTKEIGQEL
ncbi:MAG: hypothetical protein ACRCVU_20355 [Flavobacterium sp.]